MTKWLVLTLLLIAGALCACPPTLPAGTVKWSSQTAWKVVNATVNIPAGTSYVVDQSPSNALGVISVSGNLYILDATIEIVTQGIVLNANGALTIGTPECPITKKVIITLTSGGDLGTDEYDSTHLGTKGIVAKWNARLRINGYVSGPSWTRLSSTASQGSSTILLQEPVKWIVNDTIVITSTDFSEVLDKKDPRYSSSVFNQMYGTPFADQHETRTIISVSSDGKKLTLNAPLNYTHWGAGYQVAEVGLLTKRVVIRGEASSDGNFLGGHLMMRYGNHSISGLELTRMGQQGVLGRYPLHFHMARFLWGMNVSVSDSSVHDCYQRCYVIHETHGVLLENNVAYNSYGHCYFLEDGGEHGNSFIHNLGARILPSYLLISDNQPSMYWISHPNNTFIDNVASGAYIGYWFVMPVMPVRASAKFWNDSSIMSPRQTQLPNDGPRTGFRGNVAHSIYENGVQCSSMESDDLSTMTPGYWYPTTGPPFKVKVPSIISNMIIYKVRMSGVWSRGCAPATWRDMIIADTSRGIDLINLQTVINITFIGRSDNKGLPNTKSGLSVPSASGSISPVGGLIHYDVGVGMSAVNCTFYNFTDTNVSYGAWGGSTNGPGWNSAPSWLSLGMKMYNSNPVAFPTWSYVETGYYSQGRYPVQADAILDDGGLTNIPGGGWLMGFVPGLKSVPGCVFHPEYPGFQCPWFNYGYSHVNTSLNTASWIVEQADKTSYTFNWMDPTYHVKAPWLSGRAVGLVPLGKPITEVFSMQNLRYADIYQGQINGQYEIILSNATDGTLYQSPSQLVLNYIGGCAKPSAWAIYAIYYPAGTTFDLQYVSNDMYKGEVGRFSLKQVFSFRDLSWDTWFYNTTTLRLYVLLSSDNEQSYGNVGGAPWLYTVAPSIVSSFLNIVASCGDQCQRTKKADIAPLETQLPLSLQHDVYKADLTGADGKMGTVFFQMYPNYRNRNPRLAYQIYHNLVDPNITICIALDGRCVSYEFPDVNLGASNVIILTRQLWLQVSSSKTQVIVTNQMGVVMLTGNILLFDGKDGKVSVPSDTLPSTTCKPSYDTLSIFNGTTYPGTPSGYASYSFIKKDNYLPMCDNSSLSMRIVYGNYQGLKGVNMVVPSKYVSLEFYARVNNSAPLELTISNGSATTDSYTRTRSYGPEWMVTDQWSFFRVPLSAFGASRNLTNLYFWASQAETLIYVNDVTVYFSSIRLSTQAAVNYTTFTRNVYSGAVAGTSLASTRVPSTLGSEAGAPGVNDGNSNTVSASVQPENGITGAANSLFVNGVMSCLVLCIVLAL